MIERNIAKPKQRKKGCKQDQNNESMIMIMRHLTNLACLLNLIQSGKIYKSFDSKSVGIVWVITADLMFHHIAVCDLFIFLRALVLKTKTVFKNQVH